MRKSLIMTLAVLIGLICVLSVRAADDATETAAWPPPTNKVENFNCATPGGALTPEDLNRIEYTFMYRVKGTTVWTPIEVPAGVTEATMTGLQYEQTYEMMVGAHWPGGTVHCPTSVVEFTTGTEPPPGQCGPPAIQ